MIKSITTSSSTHACGLVLMVSAAHLPSVLISAPSELEASLASALLSPYSS